MPWAVIEKFDEKVGEEFMHIVPFVRVENSFATHAEAAAFAAEREAADNNVTDDEKVIIGIHVGHTLSPDCVCNPRRLDANPYCYIHNAAN